MKKFILFTVVFAVIVSCGQVKEESEPVAFTLQSKPVFDYPNCEVGFLVSSNYFPEVFVDIPEESTEIIAYFENLLATDYPDDVYADFVIGSMNFIEGNLSNAYQHFGKAVSNDVTYFTNEFYYILLSYNNLAERNADLGNLDEAVAMSSAAFELIESYGAENIPDQLRSMLYLVQGNYLWDAGMITECQSYLSNGLQLCANQASVTHWYKYGTSFMLADGDMETGVRVMNTAELYFPNDESIYYMRGSILMEMGRLREALADVLLASWLITADDPKGDHIMTQIKKIFQAARSLETEADYFDHYLTAMQAWDKNSDQEVVDGLKAVFEIEASDPYVFLIMAESLIDLEEYEEALRYLDAVSVAIPDYVWLHYYYGKAYEGLGRQSDADDSFGKVISLDSESTAALTVMREWSRNLPDEY